MQTITIDLIPQAEKPIVKVSQFDDNWDVKFLLTENGEGVELSPYDSVTCIIRKPDNNIVTIEGTILLNGTVVSLTEQACACYGNSWGELVIESGDKRKGTCNFILEVEKSPEFGGIDSDSEINNLRRQIAGIVGDEVAEVAPAIIAELAPTIIGDEYLTKAQIEAAYYSKQQTDNEIQKAKPHAIIETLEAGDTVISFTTDYPATALVEFKINEPGVNEPTIVESTSEDNRIYTLTFPEAFDHDVSIMLLRTYYEVTV